MRKLHYASYSGACVIGQDNFELLLWHVTCLSLSQGTYFHLPEKRKRRKEERQRENKNLRLFCDWLW